MVSHSGFLRTGITHVKYANADYRVFRFQEGQKEGEDLELVEWEETQPSGGMGRSEAGSAAVAESDFPAEKAEEVRESLGEKTSGEAAGEVP